MTSHLYVQQVGGGTALATGPQIAEIVTDLGLQNVDNTRDADKPICSAQATVNASVAGSLSSQGTAITNLENPPQVSLTDGYVFSTTDEGKVFNAPAGLAINVNYPNGVSWQNGILIKPAATGSVQVNATGTATINGGTAPVVINLANYPVPAALVPTAVTDNVGITSSKVGFGDLGGAVTDSGILVAYLAAHYDGVVPPITEITGAYSLQATDHKGCIALTAQAAVVAITAPGNICNGLSVWECDVFLYNTTSAAGRLKVAVGSGSHFIGSVNNSGGATPTWNGDGLLNTGPFFGGVASASCIAHGKLRCYDFTTNANRFLFTPIYGRWTAA